MTREDTLKAVDDAFTKGVKHLYDVFVQGLIAGDKPGDLGKRLERGLEFHHTAHDDVTEIVENYFRGK